MSTMGRKETERSARRLVEGDRLHHRWVEDLAEKTVFCF